MSHRRIVLLHPFPLDAGFWEPLRPLLPAGIRVSAPECPGFGTAAARPGWSVDDAADEVAWAIAQTGGPAVVCGLSLGGYVALSLVARHPGRAEALVLADTRAEADDDAARAGREASIARIAAGEIGGVLDELVPRLVAPGTPAATVDAIRAIADRQTPEAVSAALAALRDRPDRRADLEGIAVPTLAVWGSEDAVTPREAMESLAAAIPGGRLEVVPGAGHLSAFEDPAGFARAVAPFLAALP